MGFESTGGSDDPSDSLDASKTLVPWPAMAERATAPAAFPAAASPVTRLRYRLADLRYGRVFDTVARHAAATSSTSEVATSSSERPPAARASTGG